MAGKITIARSNNDPAGNVALTTYQINNFSTLMIQDQYFIDQISDLTGDETSVLVFKSQGAQMKISFDYFLINETSNVVTAGNITIGTATGGSTTTLIDTRQNWTTNQFANEQIQITGGTNSGTTKNIISNTNNTITIAGGSPWAFATDATSQYQILITTAMGQQIYLMKQFSSVSNTTNNGSGSAITVVPILDTYAITIDYGEPNARTFTENGSLSNLTCLMSGTEPTIFAGHMEFLVGQVI